MSKTKHAGIRAAMQELTNTLPTIDIHGDIFRVSKLRPDPEIMAKAQGTAKLLTSQVTINMTDANAITAIETLATFQIISAQCLLNQDGSAAFTTNDDFELWRLVCKSIPSINVEVSHKCGLTEWLEELKATNRQAAIEENEQAAKN